jgi:hypothetical protein
MNTLVISLLLLLNANPLTPAPPITQTSQRARHTRLAYYQLGTYLSMDKTKLNVNVNKQPGGQVYVQFNDGKGNVLFERTMGPDDLSVRLKLNLTELADGDYFLKVSNGLEVIMRDVKINTPSSAPVNRSITLLQ